MNQTCPDCNSTLVPSTVGQLCAGCGKLHKFNKAATASPVVIHALINDAPVAAPEVEETPPKAIDAVKTPKPSKKKLVVHTTSSQPKSSQKFSLKHHMKRLVVPELPAAHSNLSAYSNDPATIAQANMPEEVITGTLTDISPYHAEFDTQAPNHAHLVSEGDVAQADQPVVRREIANPEPQPSKSSPNWLLISAVALLAIFAIFVFWPR